MQENESITKNIETLPISDPPTLFSSEFNFDLANLVDQ